MYGLHLSFPWRAGTSRWGVPYIRVKTAIDLNIMFEGFSAIANGHHMLAEKADVHGPFHVKAHLENVWRTVPFLNIHSFLEHLGDMPPIIWTSGQVRVCLTATPVPARRA
jgi:hypothetical protein